jgi:hypothetical protein
MTDSQGFLPNAQGVSDDLLLNLKPSSVRGRSYRASIPSQNGTTFASGAQIIASIPCGRRNSFLDTQSSYFRITVQNLDGTNTLTVDNNAYSLINRIDTFNSGVKLETQYEVGVLASYIFDMQLSASERHGLSSAMGFSKTLANPREGQTIAINAQSTYCLPIFSSVAGMFTDKMVPLWALSDDIRFEILLADKSKAFVAGGGTPDYKILSFEIVATIIELSDEGMGLVQQMQGDKPIILHGTCWSHNVSNIYNGGTGSYSFLVPFRYSSLNSLVCIPRRATEINAATSYSLSSRVNPSIDNYQWRVGGSVIPNKPVNLRNANTTGNFTEAFMELLRSWHSVNSSDCAGSLPLDYYNVNDAAISLTSVSAPGTGTLSYKNGFVIAQELQVFSNRNNLLLSGINTLGQNIYFDANISTAVSADYTLNFFGNFDILYILDKQTGVLQVKF